jgi:hypothetical protein
MDLKMVSHPKGEHGLRAFENKVLRRIFGPKREEVKMPKELLLLLFWDFKIYWELTQSLSCV